MNNSENKTWAQLMCKIVDVRGTMTHKASCSFLMYFFAYLAIGLFNIEFQLPKPLTVFTECGALVGMLWHIFHQPKKINN